jgi:hypothetical protein
VVLFVGGEKQIPFSMTRIGVGEPVWSRLGGAGISLTDLEDLTGPLWPHGASVALVRSRWRVKVTMGRTITLTGGKYTFFLSRNGEAVSRRIYFILGAPNRSCQARIGAPGRFFEATAWLTSLGHL